MSDSRALRSDEVDGRREVVRRALEAAVILGALATVPVIVLLESRPGSAWINTLDWLIWGVFASELAFRVSVEPMRRRLRDHLVPLAVIILSFPLLPTFLSLSDLLGSYECSGSRGWPALSCVGPAD